ncbi:DUF92 domain-containing protein [Chitinophaga filiformis]|uniref:DUF92 domain-containing protein n=1 Tax=Chitinophaga filiformis TaxID=104663 RepID=UPI001F258123|nr:DUF92 domain-containing protein [Chitinophaga filiformis]MCF6405431.1 DUF92 domain-containing protein [Chitinophaga filiformis]
MALFPHGGIGLLILLILGSIMFICIRTKKLTIPAALLAGIIGAVTFFGTSWIGLLSLILFFILGVWATSHRKDLKAKITSDGIHPEGRKASQVFANGGVAGIVSFIACLDRSHIALYELMVAASLASALADTLSSELGMVYGRNFYNIWSFKREPKGLDGVVSLEGTLIGAAGAGMMALLYAGFDKRGIIVLLAGILGNLLDSVLGATLERNKYIGNDVVNFLNTFFAAIFAGACYALAQQWYVHRMPGITCLQKEIKILLS